MTTYYKEIKQCSVCGARNEYTGIGSTGTFGPQDLDTRPSERKRSTIVAWVQRCPDCGYCAVDLSEACCPEAREIVNSREYKERLNDPTYPELANSFLCKAIIDRKSGALAAATLSLMWAAWFCDDSGHLDQARVCRQKAAEMLVIAEDDGQQVFKREGANTAILVDLLRRSGQIEEARKAIAARRGGITEEVIVRILDFQATLLDKNDVSCHTIAEVIGQDNRSEQPVQPDSGIKPLRGLLAVKIGEWWSNVRRA
jgi:hypothetical protein